MAVMPIWWTGKGHCRSAEERHRVGDPVTAEHRHLAFVEPGQAIGVQSGQAVEPASSGPSTGVAAPRHEQDVTGAHA